MSSNEPGRTDIDIVWAQGGARTVAVRGTFSEDPQEWWQRSIPLQPQGNGRFATVLSLQPGRYEFKFVVDEEWRTNPDLYSVVGDGQGNTNNVVEVAGKGGGVAAAGSDHRASVQKQEVSERTGLLGTGGAAGQGKCLGSTTGREQGQVHSASYPVASSGRTTPQPHADEQEQPQPQHYSRVRRIAIGTLVVLLFVLLGALSALYDD